MIERQQLKCLVVATLDRATGTMKAVQLYNEISINSPEILRREKVRGFRSFVKCINQFEEVVQADGSGVKHYTTKKV
jgi:hypothetical protein